MYKIIESLLDTDFYKFTMGQFAWKYYPDVRVKYAFFNRTKSVKLADPFNGILNIDTLVEELDNVRNLKLTLDEINYLHNTKLFSKEYLEFLSKLELPPIYVDKTKNNELVIETEGRWCETIFWETFILSIVNELYYRKHTYPSGYFGEFEERLDEKINKIKKFPFKFVEFGTRRRFSVDIQHSVILRLCSSLNYDGNLIGTSNVNLAKKFELKPIGTMAHELPMIMAGLNDYNLDVLKNSHNKMLNLWYYLYGNNLSIALTDTFGSDFFFENFTKEQAEKWRGLRQDSGDPIEFANKAIKFYRGKKIDPKEKLIIFSDGLNVDKIIKIERECKNLINTAYGWGTNLTNDVGVDPLSIVVKAVEANGRPLVKLSDNLNKAVGKPEVIKKYKKAFGYTSNYEAPVWY